MGKRILTDGQRETIRKMHKKQGVTVSGLATLFGVSRATIRFVLNPKLEAENRERNKLRMRKSRSDNAKEN